MGVLLTTLGEQITASCRRWEGEPAVVEGTCTVTYGELLRGTDRIMEIYRDLGVAVGDRVLCQLPNGVLHLMVAVATWRHGGIHVVADRDLTTAEIAERARETGSVVLVVHAGAGHSADASIVRALRTRCPGAHILSDGDLPGAGAISLPQLVTDGAGEAPATAGPAVSSDDPALILFTSGSTGRSKGVVRYHGQLVDQWCSAGEVMAVRPGDVHLVQLPLSHGFGLGMATLGLMSGGTLVVMQAFSAEAALQTITDRKVTVLHGTPAHFTLLTDRLDPARHEVSSLRTGQGSAGGFPPDVLRRVFDDLGMDLMLLYGCSEGLNCHTTDRDDMLRGSVGVPPPGRVGVFVDGRRAAPGEVGEIAFRRVHRFRYWGDAQPPADWHLPGDLGRFDAEGRLYVLGRARYQINRGGLKITPEEVEARLSRCPGVADCAVIALPDRVVGERVCACVVPEAAASLDLALIRAFLGESLARHKLPEELVVLDAIPKVQLGKVDRPVLTRLARSADRERLHPRPG